MRRRLEFVEAAGPPEDFQRILREIVHSHSLTGAQSCRITQVNSDGNPALLKEPVAGVWLESWPRIILSEDMPTFVPPFNPKG